MWQTSKLYREMLVWPGWTRTRLTYQNNKYYDSHLFLNFTHRYSNCLKFKIKPLVLDLESDFRVQSSSYSQVKTYTKQNLTNKPTTTTTTLAVVSMNTSWQFPNFNNILDGGKTHWISALPTHLQDYKQPKRKIASRTSFYVQQSTHLMLHSFQGGVKLQIDSVPMETHQFFYKVCVPKSTLTKSQNFQSTVYFGFHLFGHGNICRRCLWRSFDYSLWTLRS